MRARAALVTAGILIMGYAVAGALADPDLAPAGVLTFLAGVLVVHDLLWMPLVLVAGAVITRFVPRRRRPAAVVVTVVAAAVSIVALPLVPGFGREDGNPSALPSPYLRNLLLVLFAVAVAGTLRRAGRKKSERPGGAVRETGDG
ncbi:hypothetical protein [Actinoplanes philippinensis]|uniref:hypothetical protein n=1 Tax=Actinoplanes philippinensis TaxID=35752 RepID=UPI0033CFF357